MGLVSKLLTLPVTGPAAGAFWVARKLAETAEAQRNDPATLRAALGEAERRLLAGEIDEEAYDALESDLLERLRDTRG
ncbi:gas vesicle protein [Roseivivax halodurans JCM 10272]|uniref:Gas vesicle protein n=1 Tax=Roseivivax halodurans JCM 10272 TaxID=1449350 RepID=X7EL32_9RHOB|nr:gas vesicle protein GvpG [Roseivivax halodurans]ETX15866.1 gas vesicle protein [Roseivivax halodurans JCM 10272]